MDCPLTRAGVVSVQTGLLVDPVLSRSVAIHETAAIPQGHINPFHCGLDFSKARLFSGLTSLLKLVCYTVLCVDVDWIYSLCDQFCTWLLGCSVHVDTNPDGFTPIQLFVQFVGLIGLVWPICCFILLIMEFKYLSGLCLQMPKKMSSSQRGDFGNVVQLTTMSMAQEVLSMTQ